MDVPKIVRAAGAKSQPEDLPMARPRVLNGVRAGPDSGRSDRVVIVTDRQSRRCFVGNGADLRELPLSTLEFDLLARLNASRGICLSRDRLLADVWGINFETGTNTVDVAICSLRKKMSGAGMGNVISTVRGVGYRLDGTTNS